MFVSFSTYQETRCLGKFLSPSPQGLGSVELLLHYPCFFCGNQIQSGKFCLYHSNNCKKIMFFQLGYLTNLLAVISFILVIMANTILRPDNNEMFNLIAPLKIKAIITRFADRKKWHGIFNFIIVMIAVINFFSGLVKKPECSNLSSIWLTSFFSFKYLNAAKVLSNYISKNFVQSKIIKQCLNKYKCKLKQLTLYVCKKGHF